MTSCIPNKDCAMGLYSQDKAFIQWNAMSRHLHCTQISFNRPTRQGDQRICQKKSAHGTPCEDTRAACRYIVQQQGKTRRSKNLSGKIGIATTNKIILLSFLFSLLSNATEACLIPNVHPAVWTGTEESF